MKVYRTMYFAGPLFTQAEWLWNETLATCLSELGFEVILPQRRAEPMLKGIEPFDDEILFNANVAGIERSDFLLAVLDQADPDSGTCWECGYAYKLGRPVIGIRTDIRTQADTGATPVNLMLSRASAQFIRVPFDRLNDMRWIVQRISEAVKRLPTG